MKNFLILVVLSISGLWMSCTKSDEYKKYTVGGEEVYPGKPDSLKAFPGRNRVKLNFLVQADPTVVGARVYWNSRKDSVDLLLNRSSGVDTISTVVGGLTEGTYNFEVLTYDAKGHHSVTTFITARAYGDNYEATLLNIPVNFSTITGDDAGLVVWGPFDPLSGLFGARAMYTDRDGVSRDMVVPIDATHGFAQFESFPAGGSLQYQVLYLPEPMAIDTFSSSPTIITIGSQ